MALQRILFACLEEYLYTGFSGEDSFPKALPSGDQVKLLSLSPSGAQRKQGHAECIFLAGVPRSLSEIFIEVSQKMEGELSGVKRGNILLAARVTFMLHHKMSLGATVGVITKLVCQFQCDIFYVSI